MIYVIGYIFVAVLVHIILFVEHGWVSDEEISYSTFWVAILLSISWPLLIVGLFDIVLTKGTRQIRKWWYFQR
jgi:hypothetical protein